MVTSVRGPVSTAAASSPTPTQHARPGRDARAQVLEQAALPDVGHGRGTVEGGARAGVAHREECNEKRPPAGAVWMGDLNLVTRWESCAPL